jgi:glycosyltransferase involved in cell wall biosynthesis
MKLSIIIPVYNEENTIEEIISRVYATGMVHQIIAVDDGSTDGSAAILLRLQQCHPPPPLTILHHTHNLGKGAAIRTALSVITGDIVLIQDADLEYNPKDYPILTSPFENPKTKVVYGSRNLCHNPRSSRPYYWGGRLLSCFTNLLFGSEITDEATGFKLFRANLIKGLDLQENGFSFCSEVTGKILRRGFVIHEVPISYNPRNWHEGKKIRWYDGIIAIWTLIRCRFQ